MRPLLFIIALSLSLFQTSAQKQIPGNYTAITKSRFDACVPVNYLVKNPTIKKHGGKLIIPILNKKPRIFTDDGEFEQYKYIGDIKGRNFGLVQMEGPNEEEFYQRANNKIISCVVDPKTQDIQLYWKNDSGEIFRSIQRLKDYLDRRHRRLVFAMNGGMFRADNSPQGLFIQHQQIITPLDTLSGTGNFYLKPNGILYITVDGKAGICQTTDFVQNGSVKFATQSGPMLLVDGSLHPAFKRGSVNVNIRNGVGILPDNKLLFAMSEEPINFYDFADYFKERGCLNALYLDGFVSRTYLPEKKWEQLDGNFGVIIGLSVKN
jgi:uncharacterized protein YigE (DUF2233 family)